MCSFYPSRHERLQARSHTLSPLSPVERGNEVEKTIERRNFTEIYTDCDWLLLARENAKLCNNQSEMLLGSRSLLGNSREFLA